MSLDIYIGRNKTGKTSKMIELSNELKDDFTLYLPTEIILKDFISKENLGTLAKQNLSPIARVLKFINNIYSVNSKIKVNKKIESKINQNEIKLNKIVEEMLKNCDDDIYFEKVIIKNLKINGIKSIEYTKEIEWLRMLELNFVEDKKWNDQVSSGSSSYSLLKLIFDFLKFINSINDTKIKKKIKEFKILIDEPEKFCHPELIHKIADLIYELSQTFDITISTHSSILVERIFKLDKNKKTKYIYFWKTVDDKYENENIELATELRECNSRRISQIIKAIFATNIILYEGLADEIYINTLLESIKTNKYITLLDCVDKGGIKKINLILEKLNLANKINILLVYDSDKPEKIIKSNTKYSIVMKPNLEVQLFGDEYNNSYYKSKKNECLKKNSDKLLSIISKRSLIVNHSIINNIKEIILNHEKIIILWLEQKGM